MSWHYLPGRALAALPASTLSETGKRSVMSNEKPTVSRSSNRALQTATLTTPQSGRRCEHSDQITQSVASSLASWLHSTTSSSQPAFPASHSAKLGTREGQQISETAGLTPFALFEKQSHAPCYWKTFQACLPGLGISAKFSATWPKAGMMRDGRLYRLPSWERPIDEPACGLWPTPVVSDSKGVGPYGSKSHLSDLKHRNLRGVVKTPDGGALNPAWVEWLMGWPAGWTSLERLGTAGFQRWLRLHGRG